MSKFSFLVCTILIHSFLSAQDSFFEPIEKTIDNSHETISDYVYDISNSVDNVLSGDFLREREEARKNPLYRGENSIDSFFQTEKFRNETSQAYVRVRMHSRVESKTSEDSDIKVRAHLPLSKTKHTYKNFFKDLTGTNKKDTPDGNTTSESSAQTESVLEFNSKYSIGASSFHPYLKARYFVNYPIGDWSIQPAQTFRYSSKDYFEETTDLYFDKKLSDTKLLRFQTSRHTQQHHSGMDYSFGTQYFQTLKNKSAISLSQSFWGNTKYKYALDKPTYGGISNYSTSINYRQNIWKKWFFYEITPGVNFHRSYDYKPNYSAMFSIDVFFGRTYIR